MPRPPAEIAPRPASSLQQPGLIESTLDRLEDLLDEETEALKRPSSADIRLFNQRKSQALLELTKAMRHPADFSSDAALAEKLTRVKEKLKTNSAALKMHLSALREISVILLGVIHDADSDGTYSITVGKSRAQ